jgi:hypothetical protein
LLVGSWQQRFSEEGLFQLQILNLNHFLVVKVETPTSVAAAVNYWKVQIQ